jgi:hypothetical protein
MFLLGVVNNIEKFVLAPIILAFYNLKIMIIFNFYMNIEIYMKEIRMCLKDSPYERLTKINI